MLKTMNFILKALNFILKTMSVKRKFDRAEKLLTEEEALGKTGR